MSIINNFFKNMNMTKFNFRPWKKTGISFSNWFMCKLSDFNSFYAQPLTFIVALISLIVAVIAILK